jgi:ABC-type transport system involved in cytochrome c biogenesis permease subunit|tara:strand:+ start:2872 stop:3696 length:825 start_codon:yes stop_codon:yes gene_type:complete
VNIAPLLLYAAAAVGYAWHFGKRSSRAGRAATTMLAAAALVHTFIIGMQTTEVGHLPVVGTTGALSIFVWLSSIAYLYTETTSNERSMGVFIVPLLALLQIIPTVSRYQVVARPPVLESPWFALHVSSLLFAYASFALACVIGITYVLLFKELKAKHIGFFYDRLPSLQVLDVMNARAVTIGWTCLSVGLVVGGVWATQAQAEFSDPRVQAMSVLDPTIFVALLCWIVYSFELYARRAIGWTGWRTAWLSAIGFAIVLLNFLPIGYFLTRTHNF